VRSLDSLEAQQILTEITAPENKVRGCAVDKLIAYGNDDVDFFIAVLNLGHTYILAKDTAAYDLRRLKDERAFHSLLDYALKPGTINYNGSVVYALEAFDCSSQLVQIFNILFYHGDVAKAHAQAILSEQEFEFNERDLQDIRQAWEKCKANPGLCPGFDRWAESIQASVDSFLIYLNK
jgi:hypothetical protein